MFRLSLARRFSNLHSKVCIIGGGPGGITTAAQLIKQGVVEASQITFVEGSTIHHYKPGWTLFASEDIKRSSIQRPMEKMLPWGVKWVDQYAEQVVPDQHRVVLKDGSSLTYDHLVIASGIKFNFEGVKGLQEAIADPNRAVTSIYSLDSLEKHQRARHVKFEQALFTQAQNPIICAGAPQKILHLTAEAWKKKGYNPKLMFFQAESRLFGVDFYAQEMKKLLDARKVDHRLAHKLVEVKKNNVAVFELTNGPNKGSLVEQEFDFLHAVPPQIGHPYLKGSGLADGSNFVIVNSTTCQSTTHKNVWSIGDSSNIPTSKTESAAIDEALVLVNNLDCAINKRPTLKNYSGYSACPLLVGGKKVLLAEFKYGEELSPTFFQDQRKPRRFFYWLKKYVFPFANNYLMPRGLWKGSKTLWDASAYDYKQYKAQEEAKRADIKVRF